MTEADDPRERLEAAQQRLIEHNGLDATSAFVDIGAPVSTVHHLHAGDGPPTVLVPGVASPAALFVPLMAELDDDLELYAVDRPGRGLSDPYSHSKGEIRAFTRRLLDAYLDAIGHDSVHLIGSSFGGFQSLAYAIDRPDRVDRISLVGSPAGLTRDLPLSFRLLGVKGINRVLLRLSSDDSVEEVRDTMASMNVENPSALSEPLLECILEAGNIPEQARSLRTLFESTAGLRGTSSDMVLRDELVHLESSVQFVWGSEDFFYPPSVGREVTDRIPSVEFNELSGHGHTPWLEPDSSVHELVASYLTGGA